VKKFLVLLLLTTNHLFAQNKTQFYFGYTVGSLNADQSTVGGFSLYAGHNFFEGPNHSFSLSTNLKLGMQDRTATGIIVPLVVILLAAEGSSGSSPDINSNANGGIDGGRIHLFTEFPLLLHYNFGMGSSAHSKSDNGFYIGGGMDYTLTGYTDTSGFSKRTEFFGIMADGGIRFKSGTDLNFAGVYSLRHPIGQMTHPQLFEITLSTLLK
jgi:hypothetical protein